MQRMNPEHLAPDHSVAADIFLRELPHEEQEDENNGKDDGDDDEGDGYSE